MTTVFDTAMYTVIHVDNEEHNYEVINKRFGCVEYECSSLPQAIGTAKLFTDELFRQEEENLSTSITGTVQ